MVYKHIIDYINPVC